MSQALPNEGAVFWNRCRFDPSNVGGHYESYFLRGNHPDKPLAFWVRYTIFAPRQRYDDALGELPSNKALPLVVVCPTGSRASRAVGLLRKAGYANVQSLAGGLNAWREANLPIEKTAA